MVFDPRASLLRELGGGFGQHASTPACSKRGWLFATSDTAADVEAAGYFDVQDFSRGDVILASMNNGVGQMPVGKLYLVVAGKQSGDATNLVALFGSAFG
jgi:hypothetical protein